MGYNKIPLALGFDDSTGNASGLVEFKMPAESMDASGVTDGYVLTARDGSGAWEAGGGGGTPTLPTGNNGDLLINDGGGTTYLASAASDAGIMQLDPYFTAGDDGAVAQWDGTKLEVKFPDALFIRVTQDNTVHPGEAIAKGDAVYATTTSESGNRIYVGLANAGDPSRMPAIGIAEAAIGAGANGKIITFGRADGVDTTLDGPATAGDILYVGTTNGKLAANKPDQPTELIQNVGIVSLPGTSGRIKVTGVGRSNDIPVNLDIVGSATVGTNNIFTQTDAQLDGTTASELVLTDSSNKISSVASATLFAGARLQDLKDTTDTDPDNRTLIQRSGSTWVYRTLSEVQTNSDTAGRIDLGGLGNVDDSDNPPLDIPEAQTVLYDRSTSSYVVSALKHSTLSGLGDDDHTQYVLADGTREMAKLTVTNGVSATEVSSTSSTVLDAMVTRLPGAARPDNFVWYSDYLTYNAQAEGWTYAANGGSLGHNVTLLQSTDAIGIIELKTPNANNRVHLTTFNQTVQPSCIGASMSYRVTVDSLYDATTNQGDVFLGIFNNSNTATDPTNGFFFRYSDASANWQAETVSVGTTTRTDTGVAVAVGTFNVLQIICNNDWTEVKFYVDGDLKATHTTNIPTAHAPGAVAIKSVNGATSSGQEIHMDWHLFRFFSNADRGQSHIQA